MVRLAGSASVKQDAQQFTSLNLLYQAQATTCKGLSQLVWFTIGMISCRYSLFFYKYK